MKDEGILARRIFESRKELGVTQEILAEKLGITPQSISRWENGQSRPDVDMLPRLAAIFGITVDSLFGYHAENLKITQYEQKYRQAGYYYWDTSVTKIAREILGLLPPDKPRTILEIGCGEGCAAVFFARNGYIVSAFDIDEVALSRAEEYAAGAGVNVNFFRADMLTYTIESQFDIIYSSGVAHFIPPDKRENFFKMIQAGTAVGGLNAINAFVDKSFIGVAPDVSADTKLYHTAELFGYYGRDWKFELMDEIYLDSKYSGIPHQHCIDMMIARKISN